MYSESPLQMMDSQPASGKSTGEGEPPMHDGVTILDLGERTRSVQPENREERCIDTPLLLRREMAG
jgi:hypothetical protein